MPSDHVNMAVEAQNGWLIPPEWEFQGEVWAYEREPVRETVYDHDSEVQLLDESRPLSGSERGQNKRSRPL